MALCGAEAVGRGWIQIWCALLWFLGAWAWFLWFGCAWLSLVHVLVRQDLVPLASGMCGAEGGGSRAGCDGS